VFATRRSYIPQILSHLPGQLFLAWFVFHAGYDSQGNRQFTLFDDAMISMTYAKTFANSGELVWYPGAEAVQGFTNLLWTVFMSAVHFLGFSGSDASLVVSLTGILVITLIATQVQSIVARHSRFKSEVAGNLAAGATYFMYPLVFWTLRGMEVGIQALLILVLVRATIALQDPQNRRGFLYLSIFCLVVSGILIRIDFVVSVIAVLSFYAISAISGSREKAKVAILLAVSLMIGVATILGVQKLVWGEFLPNTYYLKVDGFSLFDRVARGFWNILELAPLMGLIALAVVILLTKNTEPESKEIIAILSAVFYFMVAYSIYVGGDAWETFFFANRYISTVLPAALIISFIASPPMLRAFSSRFTTGGLVFGSLGVIAISGTLFGFQSNPLSFSPLLALVATASYLFSSLLLLMHKSLKSPKLGAPSLMTAPAVVIILASSIPISLLFQTGTISATESDARMTEFGISLREITKPDATIATLWAGAPAYYSERRMVDLLGKSDRELARSEMASLPDSIWNAEFYPGHNKYDLGYSIETWRPDVIAQTLGLPDEPNLLRTYGYVEYCIETRISTEKIFVFSKSESIIKTKLEPCKGD